MNHLDWDHIFSPITMARVGIYGNRTASSRMFIEANTEEHKGKKEGATVRRTYILR